MRRIRSHLSYANVMVTILAFFVLTGGTAVALSGSNTVFTDDIANDTQPAGGGNPAGGLAARRSPGRLRRQQRGDGQLIERHRHRELQPHQPGRRGAFCRGEHQRHARQFERRGRDLGRPRGGQLRGRFRAQHRCVHRGGDARFRQAPSCRPGRSPSRIPPATRSP